MSLNIPAARAIIARASAGPWNASPYDTRSVVDGLDKRVCVVEYHRNENDESDATFIAAAREGWPAALDECERLRAELAHYEAMADAVECDCGVAAMLRAERDRDEARLRALAAGGAG